jgi:hypothetical protein
MQEYSWADWNFGCCFLLRVKELEWIGAGMMKPMAMRALDRRAVRVIQEEPARV